MVAATARRNPTAIAVSFGAREITYAELDRRADALAQRLQRLGVGPDSIVAVLLDRSEDLVVALLGVLKAGGGLIPQGSAATPQPHCALLTRPARGARLRTPPRH